MMHLKNKPGQGESELGTIQLPQVGKTGSASLEQTLWERRSLRQFSSDSISMETASQLLWAAQGINDQRGRRTCPSAGALYPLEVLMACGAVQGLSPGCYRYLPHAHALEEMQRGDLRGSLARASLDQSWMAHAPAILVLSAVYARTTGKYGPRGVRYVHMEVGAAAQNIHLQAEALGVGTVFVGAFSDREVQRILGLPAEEEPLALFPTGAHG